MDLTKVQIKKYLEKTLGSKVSALKVSELGSGIVGTGYLLKFFVGGEEQELILKSIFAKNLNLDYPADRAQSFLLAHDSYNSMESHVGSRDVLLCSDENELKSIGNSKEFFILMDKAHGTDFFQDFEEIRKSDSLTYLHKKKILALSDFLVKIHSKKVGNDSCYRRKIRDTVAGDGSILQILDAWPKEEFVKFEKDWNEIIKRSVDVWSVARGLTHRNVEVHGDFHPGNLWFDDMKLTVLDRARGKYGEPADDISAFLLNPIFYSVSCHGYFCGAFKDMFDLFWNNYFSQTKDKEMRKVLGLFFAFRATVVCNPVFYPDDFFDSKEKAFMVRKKIITFVKNVLRDDEFNPAKINYYLEKGF